MPRLHFVKKARKDNPAVKAGESYYWWQFRNGGKRYSATRPRRSQLTQSNYFATLYDLQDAIENADIDGVQDAIENAASELENLREECQGSLDNMPESLQYSPTGELLQERIDACDMAIDELQTAAQDEFEFWHEEHDPDPELEGEDIELDRAMHEQEQEAQEQEEREQFYEEKRSEAISALDGCVI